MAKVDSSSKSAAAPAQQPPPPKTPSATAEPPAKAPQPIVDQLHPRVADNLGKSQPATPPAAAGLAGSGARGMRLRSKAATAPQPAAPARADQKAQALLASLQQPLAGTNASTAQREATLDAAAALLRSDPRARALLSTTLAQRTRALKPGSAVDPASENIATALGRCGSPDAVNAARDYRLAQLAALADNFATFVANNDHAYAESALAHDALRSQIAAGKVKLAGSAATRFANQMQQLQRARAANNGRGRTHAASLTAYLLNPDVARSLRPLPLETMATTITPSLRALRTLNQRLVAAGEAPLASLATLQQQVIDDLLRVDKGGAQAAQLPHLTLLLAPVPSEGEGGDHAGTAHDQHSLAHYAASISAKTNWTRNSIEAVASGAEQLLQTLMRPTMSIEEVTSLRHTSAALFARFSDLAGDQRGQLHFGKLGHTVRGLGALAAVYETYAQFAAYKTGKIGGAELTTKVGFYAIEVIEFAEQISPKAHRAIAKYIEQPLEKYSVKTLEALFVRQGASHGMKAAVKGLSHKAIPIAGNLLAAGACFFDMAHAVDANDTSEAITRGAEGLGWTLIGTGAAASATGLGAAAGAPLMIIGGVVVVGSYVYDAYEYLSGPNDAEKLAERLGYAYD